MVRGEFDLEYELETLRKIADRRRKEVEQESLPELSASNKELLDKVKKAKTIDEAREANKNLPIELRMYLIYEGRHQVARSPYHFSSLRNWLALETWLPRDAMLLLAGLCPKAAVVDWTYKNFMGADIDEPKIRAATCLSAIDDDYDVPPRDSWDDEIHEVKQALFEGRESMLDDEKLRLNRELERLMDQQNDSMVVRRDEELSLRSTLLSRLSRHWFSGDHDAEKRYSPEHYLGWAAARGYKPEWYEWALSQGLIDVHESVYRQPFFDPDSADYPELLHIAVSAWQEARKGSVGTPKQRIERFLQERYSAIPPTTREMIAQLVNWHRTGGRPKS